MDCCLSYTNFENIESDIAVYAAKYTWKQSVKWLVGLEEHGKEGLVSGVSVSELCCWSSPHLSSDMLCLIVSSPDDEACSPADISCLGMTSVHLFWMDSCTWLTDSFPPLFAVILHQPFQDIDKWEYVSERVVSTQNMGMFISLYMPL